MKRVLVLAAAVMAVVISAKAEVEFAYDAGAEIVSAYIWRGQYNGGLSFQPDVEIGFDGEHTSLRVGAWASLGSSDWTFRKDQGDGTGFTRFMPELDIVGSFSVYGLGIGFNHYYYFDGTNFFSWTKDENLIDPGTGDANTQTTTEVWIGYNFGHLFGDKAGAYINWYTTVAGGDFVADDITGDPRRAWSSYLELGYGYTFEDAGVTLGAQIGMSPWKSTLYGNNRFAVTNISLKIDKEWELDHCSINLFAQGSLNPDGMVTDPNDPAYNVVLWKAAGDDKLYTQRLNGVIGIGFWF